MVQGNEIIGLLLMIPVILFLILNRRTLRVLPKREIFYASFGALLVGQVMTVAEGFIFEDILNIAEHAAYAVGAVGLAVWSCKAFGEKGPA